MLIGLTGPSVTICPTVSVPLAGISEVKMITELANLDSWHTSNKMAPNVCLPVSRNFLWDTLTSSASNFVDLGPQGEILYLPILLTNSRKRRFAAGALKGPFPVEVQPLDSDAETGIISSLCKELNDSYCLALPAVPNLDRGSVSLCQDLEVKRLVVIGSSHAGKLSPLLTASLETQFLKLPSQSQTQDAAEDLADRLREFQLSKEDIVYLDLLSNQVYLGTDVDGNSTDPHKDRQNRWHITGSLVPATKPRLRRILERMVAIRDACGAAKIICGLPTPRYVEQGCYKSELHIDNILEEEYKGIHEEVKVNSKTCLLAAFPNCTVLDPMQAFRGEDENAALSDLISSGGLSIWKEGDPVHLTDTAYGDIADFLMGVIRGKAVEEDSAATRKRLDSVVTRSLSDPVQRPVAGWLLGGNQGRTQGRGFLRGQGPRGGRGGRGLPPHQRVGNGGRWAPY